MPVSVTGRQNSLLLLPIGADPEELQPFLFAWDGLFSWRRCYARIKGGHSNAAAALWTLLFITIIWQRGEIPVPPKKRINLMIKLTAKRTVFPSCYHNGIAL